MPRQNKYKNVSRMPRFQSFGPAGCSFSPEDHKIILNVEEYEALRLIDYEGLTQEACAERMDVARTTVQAIYTSARHKLAHCLVEGKALRIEGGEYELCPGGLSGCGCRCHRGCVNEERNEENETCGHL